MSRTAGLASVHHAQGMPHGQVPASRVGSARAAR